MSKTIKQVFGLLVLTGFLASCGEEPKATEETTVAVVEEQMSEADLAQADAMIKNMPSPIEMAILVKHAGGEYNSSLLNDVNNLDN